jgi:hypothetical protein
MIALRRDCLLIASNDGPYIPCSMEHLTIEFVGPAAQMLDPEVLRHASAAVIHYFKVELGCEVVSTGQFTEALSKVLDGLGVFLDTDTKPAGESSMVRVLDLRTLAAGASQLGELEFCWRLRSLLREFLSEKPERIEFRGLRGCVKVLADRQHWCQTCERVETWIIDLVREWYAREPAAAGIPLVMS